MPEASFAPEVLSPREIADLARDAGFEPLGVPYQRGLVYTLAALNPDGDDGRLVIDARSGRVLRFMPAWQMGDAMETVTVASYGRIQGLPRFIEHNPPRPPRSVGRLASRTPPTNPPLPRPSPQQSTKGPSPAAAGTAATAVAPVKDASKPATDAAKIEPGKTEPAKTDATPKQEAAATQTKPAAAPAPAPVEAKPAPAGPAIQPTEAMPPVQGLE